MGRVGSVLVVALLGLTGCVSAQEPPAGSAQDSVNRPSGPQDPRCAVFDSRQLSRVLGQPFEGPINTADSTPKIAECQWTADSQTALVLVKVADNNADFLFRESAEAASRSLGEVTRVAIPGADKAYALASLGRIGMLVSGSYVEVSTLVPGADNKQIVRLASIAAGEAG
jgi:hypothetical protein